MKTYMFAISFDLEISELKKHYGEPYNNAYFEIKEELKKFGFDWVQGSMYLCDNEDLRNLFATMNHLKTIDWFKKAVRDIRAFRVEQWSDFTNEFKEG